MVFPLGQRVQRANYFDPGTNELVFSGNSGQDKRSSTLMDRVSGVNSSSQFGGLQARSQNKTTTQKNVKEAPFNHAVLAKLLEIRNILTLLSKDRVYAFDMAAQGDLVIKALGELDSKSVYAYRDKEEFSRELLLQWCDQLILRFSPSDQSKLKKTSISNEFQIDSQSSSLETPLKKGATSKGLTTPSQSPQFSEQGVSPAASSTAVSPAISSKASGLNESSVASSQLLRSRLSKEDLEDLQATARKFQADEIDDEIEIIVVEDRKEEPNSKKPVAKVKITTLQKEQTKEIGKSFDSRAVVIQPTPRISRWGSSDLKTIEDVKRFCDSGAVYPYRDLTQDQLKKQIYKHCFPGDFFRLLSSKEFLERFLIRYKSGSSAKENEKLYLIGNFNTPKDDFLNGEVFVSVGLNTPDKRSKGELSVYHLNYHFKTRDWSQVNNDLRDENIRNLFRDGCYKSYALELEESPFSKNVQFSLPEDPRQSLAVVLNYTVSGIGEPVVLTIYPRKNPS